MPYIHRDAFFISKYFGTGQGYIVLFTMYAYKLLIDSYFYIWDICYFVISCHKYDLQNHTNNIFEVHYIFIITSGKQNKLALNQVLKR